MWCWPLLIFSAVLAAGIGASNNHETASNCSSDIVASRSCAGGIAEGFVEGMIRQLAENSLRLGELKKYVTDLSEANEELKTKYNTLQAEFSEMEANHSALRRKYTMLENDQATLNQKCSSFEDRLNSTMTDVAFHAYQSSGSFSVASQGTIVYDTVTINLGGGYDRLSGIFTTPVSGTYSFFTNCMALPGKQIHSYIMAKGSTVAKCHSNNKDTYEQGATQVIVTLNAGERAWVKMQENAQGIVGSYWATFSGFLIRPDL